MSTLVLIVLVTALVVVALRLLLSSRPRSVDREVERFERARQRLGRLVEPDERVPRLRPRRPRHRPSRLERSHDEHDVA